MPEIQPLVSVSMPCFNASATLPKALKSLQNQTHQNWECLLVDDGSTDGTAEIVKKFNEPRFKYFRFEENRGRPFARQFALENANGKYITTLDADDWMFSQKLEKQVQVLENQEDIALVSCATAIVDRAGNLKGVRPIIRGGNFELRGFGRLGHPDFPSAPAMYLTEMAKKFRYDEKLLLSQDTDFNLKIALGKRYAILPEPLYVYSEIASVTQKKIFRQLAYNIFIFEKYKTSHPFASRYNILKIRLKQIAYSIAFQFFTVEEIVKRRSRMPDEKHVSMFNLERAQLENF